MHRTPAPIKDPAIDRCRFRAPCDAKASGALDWRYAEVVADLAARRSWISRWRGTVERRLRPGLCHDECRPPSRNITYVDFRLAEVAVPRVLFASDPRRIDHLRGPWRRPDGSRLCDGERRGENPAPKVGGIRQRCAGRPTEQSHRSRRRHCTFRLTNNALRSTIETRNGGYLGDVGLMDERAGRVRRAGKAAIESLADNLFDDLLRFLPFGNVTRIIARAVNAATMAYLLDETNKSSRDDISKALAAREVETIFTQRLADRSDFPEQSKAQMRKAIVSEFEKLIDELEVAEKPIHQAPNCLMTAE